jgi:hypothetical protein
VQFLVVALGAASTALADWRYRNARIGRNVHSLWISASIAVPSDIPPVRRRDTPCLERQSLTPRLLLGGGMLRLRQGQLFRVNNGLVDGRPRRAEIGEFRLGAVALQDIDR